MMFWRCMRDRKDRQPGHGLGGDGVARGSVRKPAGRGRGAGGPIEELPPSVAIAGLLDTPDGGRELAGRDMGGLSDRPAPRRGGAR